MTTLTAIPIGSRVRLTERGKRHCQWLPPDVIGTLLEYRWSAMFKRWFVRVKVDFDSTESHSEFYAENWEAA